MGQAPNQASNFKDKKRIVVGVSDMAMSRDPDSYIITHSLGSCIGLITYDKKLQIGGLLHFQLHDSKGREDKVLEKPYMFADVAVPELIEKMYKHGSNPNQIEISIFGGASMLGDENMFKIGIQNTRTIKKLLWQQKLRIKHEDVGEKASRTVSVDIGTGIIELQKDGEKINLK